MGWTFRVLDTGSVGSNRKADQVQVYCPNSCREEGGSSSKGHSWSVTQLCCRPPVFCIAGKGILKRKDKDHAALMRLPFKGPCFYTCVRWVRWAMKFWTLLDSDCNSCPLGHHPFPLKDTTYDIQPPQWLQWLIRVQICEMAFKALYILLWTCLFHFLSSLYMQQWTSGSKEVAPEAAY